MVVKALIDLFYPPRCPFCNELLGSYRETGADLPEIGSNIGIPGLQGLLCSRCANELPWIEKSCPKCAFPLAEGKNKCYHCSGRKFSFEFCSALGRYRGKARDALHRFKYRGKKYLAEPLGKLLSKKIALEPWISSVDYIVPIPLSRQRFSERGYNQASLLAKVLSRELSLPMEEFLERVKNTGSQTGLNRRQRAENLSRAFSCCRAIPGGSHILLVDDVFTSGATANEASKVLKESGAARVSVAVLAR